MKILTLKAGLAPVVIAMSIIAGCTKSKTSLKPDKMIEVRELSSQKDFESVKELGYNSVEEMLKNGWEIIAEFNKDNFKGNSRIAARANLQQDSYVDCKLEPNDLLNFGFNTAFQVCSLFKEGDITPTQIELNPSNAGGGGLIIPRAVDLSAGPAYKVVASRAMNGIPATLRVGPISAAARPQTIQKESGSVRTYFNGTAVSMPFELQQKIQKGYTTTQTHSTEFSKTMEHSGTLVLAGLTATGSVSVTAGESKVNVKNESELNIFDETIPFDVPTGKARDLIYMVEKVVTRVDYSLPMQLFGRVEAYYSYKVGGSNYKTFPASRLAPYLRPEKGTVEVVDYGRTRVLASAPRDLSPDELKVIADMRK